MVLGLLNARLQSGQSQIWSSRRNVPAARRLFVIAGGSVQAGFSAGLVPCQNNNNKKNLSCSRGQKPKLESKSRGDGTCKAELEVMGQCHCKWALHTSKSKVNLTTLSTNKRSSPQWTVGGVRGYDCHSFVLLPDRRAALSTQPSTLPLSLYLQLKTEKQVQFVSAVNPVCLVSTICTDSLSLSLSFSLSLSLTLFLPLSPSLLNTALD